MNEEKLQIILEAEMSKFAKQMTEAIRKTDDLTEAIDNTDQASKKAEKQTESYTNRINQQAKELSILKDRYAYVVATQGENSETAKELAKSIQDTSQMLKNNKLAYESAIKAADKFDYTLQEVENSLEQVEESLSFTDTIKKQEKDLSALKAEYIELIATHGDSSEEARELAGYIESLSDELKHNKDVLKKATEAADAFDYTIEKVDEALEAAERAAKEAAEELERMAEVAAKSDEAIDKAMDGIKNGAKIALTAFTGAITGAVAGMVALVENTDELRKNQDKLNASFASAGGSAEVAAEVYDNLYRVLGDDGQAVEAAQHLAKLTTNQKELTEWTEVCQGIYATFGASLPIEGLTEAVNHTSQLGEVQGVLADALEWSGINVDDFNAELAECNTVSERGKKIRDTLTKTYKNAATQYEKTAKATLDSNKAQNDMNKLMAESAKKVKPVVDKLKELGVTVLQKVQDPLEDVTDFILEDLFPALENTAEFVVENKGLIIGAVTGLTAATVTYKGAVVAAKLAEEGITVATLARAAAQKVLNAAMAATPTGLVITALAALGVGLAAYAMSTNEATAEVKTLTNEEKVLIESINAEAESIKKRNEAYEDTASSSMSEHEHLTRLAGELKNLTSLQGEVSQNDQQRVQFILNELNSALGTEITMVDGVIQNYEDLESTIYDVITAKTANALLEAKNEEYVIALQKEKTALEELSTQQDNYAQAEAAYKDWYENTYTPTITNLLITEQIARRDHNTVLELETKKKIEDLNKEKEEEEKILGEKKTALETASSNYAGYYKDIEDYQKAAMLVQRGEHDEAIALLTSKGNSWVEYSGKVDAETQKVIDALAYEAIQAGIKAQQTKSNYENGVDGYTKKMVKEAEEGYEKALAEFDSAYKDANGIGEDLGDGLKNGMNNKESSIVQKARSLVSSIFSAMRKEADSHSPSKKTIALGEDLGAGAEIGLDNSTKDVTKAGENLITATLKPIEDSIRGLRMRNFNGIFDNLSLSASIGSYNNTSLNSINSQPLEAIAAKLAKDNNTQIILQVDGKTFAEVSIDTLNEYKKRTGKLPLQVL